MHAAALKFYSADLRLGPIGPDSDINHCPRRWNVMDHPGLQTRGAQINRFLSAKISTNDEFAIRCIMSKSIHRIICRAGTLVEHIKFEMYDGSEQLYGGTITGGNEQSPFVVDESDVVVRIEGEHQEWESHPGQILLGRIRFVTRSGKASLWYGKAIETSDENYIGQISFTADAENPIIGIVSNNPGSLKQSSRK